MHNLQVAPEIDSKRNSSLNLRLTNRRNTEVAAGLTDMAEELKDK
jgi:hypothetical protein